MDFANSKDEPHRNIDCFYYLECLDVVAKKNLNNLGCFKCDYRDNKSYIMNESDFRGLIELHKHAKKISFHSVDSGISERLNFYELRRFFTNINF